MESKGFYDLLKGSFPGNFDLNEFKSLAKLEWWKTREKLACAYALRKSSQIDWNAYLQNNVDVKNANMDPVLHFINEGIFEGRKLYRKNPYSSGGSEHDQPLVTVIVANYNNGLFLEKSIGSLIVQTLRNIEILVVDDCSSDDSPAIIEKFIKKDKRIRMIRLPHNQSLHLVRRAGIMNARGKSIMFLDADDFLSTDACEVAAREMAKGFDIVSFGTTYIFIGHDDPAKRSRAEKWINGGQDRVYENHEIAHCMFEEDTGLRCLSNKLYDSGLLKSAFKEMVEIPLYKGQDRYEICIIALKAMRMVKISNRLYNYRYRNLTASSSGKKKNADNILLASAIVNPLREYSARHGMNGYIDPVIETLKNASLNTFVALTDPDDIQTHFYNLIDTFGLVEIVAHLATTKFWNYTVIIEKLLHIRRKGWLDKNIRTIGMMYGTLGNGGAEKVIIELANALVARNYNVVLFLVNSHKNEEKLDSRVQVYYIGLVSNQRDPVSWRLRHIAQGIKRLNVDIMLAHDPKYELFIWEMMLLHALNVPVIAFFHSAFYRALLDYGSYLDMYTFNCALKCVDKVVCLSRESEIFFRVNGIDAIASHNPIDEVETPQLPFSERRNKIVVFGRMADPIKQATECLKIIREIVTQQPSIQVTFIGSFVINAAQKQFFQKVSELGLWNNVRLTGWMDNPSPLLDEAALLLAASYSEAFPLSMGEAQAHGLPCVIYDLPISIAEDNESIIRISQGAYKESAAAVVDLLNDEERWLRLSKIARAKVKKFSMDRYMAIVNNVLKNFDRQSVFHIYTPDEYRKVMRILAFYGSQLPPWRRS